MITFLKSSALLTALYPTVFFCVFAGGSPSPGPLSQAPSLPEIPQLTLEHFPLTIRDKVQQAYAAVLARPQDAFANGRLGMILEAYNPADARAEVCYRRAHLLDPAAFRWGYYLGLVLAAEGKYDEAVVTLRAVLPLYPECLAAQLKLGECLLGAARWEEAAKAYEIILQTHSDCAEGFYGLGRARVGRRDLGGAIEAFQKACALFPMYGAAHYALALAHRNQGRSDLSKQEMQLFQRNKRDVPGSGDQFVADLRDLYTDPQDLLQMGTELANKGELEAAVTTFEKALETDPQLVKAHVNLIAVYGRLGQPSKAEEHFRSAVSLLPNYPESYYYYGVLLSEQGKSREAEEAFRKAIDINPYHADAHYGLGDLWQRQGRWKEASEEFRKAIENRPNFPLAEFNLGRLLVNEGSYQEGILHLLKSLKTEDAARKPSYLYAVGAAYARAGDRQNAAQYLREAREQAEEQHQARLVTSIDRDLEALQPVGASPPH